MRDTIKQRIMQVRRGEVPKGYHKTQAGIIPKQWQCDRLGKYIKNYNELSNDVKHLPVVTSSRQGLLLQSEYYTEERLTEKGRGYHVVPRGYVTYRHMSDDQIFRFNLNTMADKVLVSPEYPVFCTTEKMNLSLLVLHLNTSRQFESFCQAQKKGSTRTRMYFKNLGQYILPVPPIEEQQKIAEILAQCDKVIMLKQELLDEKRKQKKWLMQKLLDANSDISLSEFEGNKWKREKLSSLGTTYSGLSGKSIENFGAGKPYIPYQNVYANYIIKDDNFGYVDIPPGDLQNKVKCGDIFFTTSSETPDEVGMSATYLGNADELYLNSFCFGYRLNNFNTLCPEFATYLFQSRPIKRILYKLAQGATRYNLSKTDFMKEYITFPSTIAEQTAIANVLSTADKEIDLLEQELALWKEKKKSLTQLLLTGLVRI